MTYLANLLDKRLKLAKAADGKAAGGDGDEKGNSLNSAEETLLELLLNRFTSFGSGAMLMDELEVKPLLDLLDIDSVVDNRAKAT